MPAADARPRARRALCLECRTLQPAGEPCARSRRHEIIALDTEHGRAALSREVWDTPFVPIDSVQLEWLVGGALLLPVALGMIWTSAWVAVFTALASAGAFAAGASWKQKKPAADDMPPRGRPGSLRSAQQGEPRCRGTLQGTSSLIAPLTGRPCLAYQVILRANDFFGGDVMLDDAFACGGEVILDDGRAIQIPEGALEITDAAPARITNQAEIERYLAAIEPALPAAPRGPVPFDVATESIVAPNTTVEIVGRLVEVPGMYRESGRRWRPRGTPFLRVVAAKPAKSPAAGAPPSP